MRKLLLIAALTTVCAFPAHAVVAQTAIVVRIVSAQDDLVTPVLFAVRTGRFRAAGLDVRLMSASSGEANVSSVVAGLAEIGKASVMSLSLAHQNGKPVTILAPAGIADSHILYGALVVPQDAAIRTARDLNGKTIAVTPRANDWVAMRAWLDANGGDSRTLKLLELPQKDHFATIEQGLADAATMLHPELDEALATKRVRAFANIYDAIAPRFCASAWFANSKWVAGHRKVVETFIRVLREAAIYTNAHPAETVAMVAAFSGIPIAVVRTMPRNLSGTMLDPALFQPVVDAAAKYGVLSRPFPARELLYTPGR